MCTPALSTVTKLETMEMSKDVKKVKQNMTKAKKYCVANFQESHKIIH